MKGSELLVRALENEGVKVVFGVPGEENLDLLEALSESDIRLVVTRHEQAAGFMAATYGRLTAKAGVCLATLGPGATNLLTAVAYANLGAMPMVALTGQKPIRSSKQGRFQILDVVDMMDPVTKSSRQLDGADLIGAAVREAFRAAQSERPGATHLELPEDIAAEDTAREPIAKSVSRRPLVEEKALQAGLRSLRESKHPLLILGAGANRKQACRNLTSFVEKSGIFFATTQMGKGVVSEDSPYYLGTCAWSSGDYIHQAIEEADTILLVGHDAVEKPPFFMKKEGRTIIHLNYVEAEVDPVYFPQVEMVGDIADAARRLTEGWTQATDWDNSHFLKIRQILDQDIEQYSARDDFPLHPGRVVSDLREKLAPHDIITLDNGLYKLWFARNYPALAPNTLLLDNALASMGAGLPSAIAAKMVHPERRVVAVCGDGGFMMSGAELETAHRLGLDLVVIVLRDDALGMIKAKQNDLGFRDYGLDFDNPDLVQYAQAFGARGVRIEATEQFAQHLDKAFEGGGIWLLDVPLSYDGTADPPI